MFCHQKLMLSICRYFAQLNSDQLHGLLAIYEPDFELFGYNSTKYRALVRPADPVPALPTASVASVTPSAVTASEPPKA